MRCVSVLCLCLVVLATLTSAAPPAAAGEKADAIMDFESGAVELTGYPEQDNDPYDWELVSPGWNGSEHALRLHGNTWKVQAIAPRAVADSTVWQVAVNAERKGEMQAIGFSDGTNELFYTLAGRDLPEGVNWWTVYQGAYPLDEWWTYLLPVGEDWWTTFGYLPEIERLIYVNDADSGQVGSTIFDAIIDVSEDQPVPPQVNILYTVDSTAKVGRDLYQLGISFQGTVFDPDSDEFRFHWDFGDSTVSDLQNPQHEFLVHADYPYTVGLVVLDELGLAGGDTCQVVVHPGSQQSELTVNFVGDVFTGRGYESNGGIIDTQGVEALFEPTLSIFGQAADVNVANLEVSYTDRGTPHPTKSVVFRSRPENIVGIQYAGVDIVTLGNNHIIDYGETGMLDTMESLDGMNIPYFGAGVNEYFALQPAFWSEKGVRLAFLGLCNRTGRAWNYQPFLDAGYSKPGFAYLLPDNLQKSIDFARELSDIVIVQTHSGDEYEVAPPPDGALAGLPGAGPQVIIEADGIGDDQPEFRFRNEPTPGERELRRLALDYGADILINHHPHVLQGFEAWDGKLIAHSLGNFIFDLYYPETMPTLVLTLEMDKVGITGYRFTPAWINHWIPQRATGNLGREIIDRLADYSRPMNALVVPLPETGEARIHLSRADVDSTVLEHQLDFQLEEQDGTLVSPPLAMAGAGYLSAIQSVMGDEPGIWEVSWGREILWHTGFEDEGADFWDINTEDEWRDSDNAHSGQYSLALRREKGDGVQTGTDLIRHLPCLPDKRHSFTGWFKADNAGGARIMARFYNARYNETPLNDTPMAEFFVGTCDWTRQWLDLETPDTATYFEVRCGLDPPESGEGLAWFDDIAFIEWEPWAPAGDVLEVAAPNNHRFLQVRRAGTGTGTGTIVYQETTYGRAVAPVFEPTIPAMATGLSCYPNPFNPRTTIELALPGGGGQVPVKLELYDLRGRKVTTLFEGDLPSGLRHGFTWNGQDSAGRAAASGVYFCRARLGEQTANLKLMLVR